MAEAQRVEIGFEGGDAVSLDGERLSPVEPGAAPAWAPTP